MTESIGGRIELIGQAITTLKEVIVVVDAALSRDTSTTGRDNHKASIGRLLDQINILADVQVAWAAKVHENTKGDL